MATSPATAHEFSGLQHALGELTPERWPPPATLSRIGGCFVCFEPVHGAGATGWRAELYLMTDVAATVAPSTPRGFGGR